MPNHLVFARMEQKTGAPAQFFFAGTFLRMPAICVKEHFRNEIFTQRHACHFTQMSRDFFRLQDTCVKGNFRNETFAQQDICATRHLRNNTFAQRDICATNLFTTRHLSFYGNFQFTQMSRCANFSLQKYLGVEISLPCCASILLHKLYIA